MGMFTAMDLAQQFDLRTAVSLHFSTNCYPPVPHEMLDTAIEAIDLANCEMYNAQVQLPDGVTYRGLTSVSAYEIIDSYRLYAFIESWSD